MLCQLTKMSNWLLLSTSLYVILLGMAQLALRLTEHRGDFNLGREHAHFSKIYRLYQQLKVDMVQQLPELGVAHSNWHDQWVFTREQIFDVCDTFVIPRYQVELAIIENKLRAQGREHRDLNAVHECLEWVIGRIALETAPAQKVIRLRAEGISFGRIFKLCPGRFYPSVVEDYVNFLRKLVGVLQYEYLRRRV